jgi:O-antigen/teichoic acid export membrane protein
MTGWKELRAIARNAASSYGLRILRGVSVLLLTPYLFRSLGVGGFGTWSVMFTVATVFVLLEEGVSVGVTKFVAELSARGRRRELDETVGAAVVLMGAAGLVGAAIALAVGLLAPGLAAEGDREGFQVGMAVLAAGMVVRFPFVAYGAALMGFQRYDLYNAAQAVATLGFAAGALVAVESGAGVLGLAIAYSAALAAGGVLFVLMLARAERGLSLRPRLGERGARRRIGTFGSLALVADTMVFAGQRMDTVVIAAIRSAAQAAPFAAAIKLAGGLQALTFPFITLLMPMVSDLKARGERAEVVRRMMISTRVAAQLTLPAAVAFALFSVDIVDVWLGADAPDVTADIIAVLMAVQVLTLTTLSAEKVLVGVGKVKLVAGLAGLEGVSNVALSIALVSAHGAIGAALGTLFTSGLLAPLKLPLAARATGSSTLALLREAVLPAFAASLPAVAAMFAVWLLLDPGAVRLAAGLAAGLAISAAIGAAQLKPRETIATLRMMRATAATTAG